MMALQQFIFTACIVNFGFTSVQLQNRIADQETARTVNEESQVRKNFQNLFDSIAKKNTGKSEIYHDVLKQEVARKRQAFETMKGEVKIAQHRNAYKKRNFYQKSDATENVGETKRETSDNDDSNGGLVASVSTNISPLPNECDNFEEIRSKNKVYVDKTIFVTKLLQSDHRFFRMCRPGRFGKSNFLQMLKSFFAGEKKLFEGLSAVRDANHDWRSYPLIYLDFDLANLETLNALKTELSRQIVRAGERYGVRVDERLPVYRDVVPPAYQRDKDVPEDCVLIKNEGRVQMVPILPVQTQLGQLVHALTNNGTLPQTVVILIDEYDWPVRQFSSNYGLPSAGSPSSSEDFGTFLETFFYQFVHLERSIKFLFMTCTTKLCLSARHKIGEKHGLDSSSTLQDISTDPKFRQMIGLTEEELRSDPFKPHIEAMIVNNPNETFHTILEKLRKRYNGYSFLSNKSSDDGSSRLYNFHSVMSCLRRRGDYFWHPASDAKYALEKYAPRKTITRMPINLFKNFTIPRHFLEKSYTYDELIPMAVSMVLHGYLTFQGYKEQTDEFILGFPNDEMRKSFQGEYMSGEKTSNEDFLENSQDLRDSLVVHREQKKQSLDTFSSSEIYKLVHEKNRM